MDKNLEKLKTMDRAEILNDPAETMGDYELLDLAAYFREDKKDEDREMAVIELILRSPLNDEMVAYSDLYLDLINYYQRNDNFPAMLRWAVAHIAYDEQNDPDTLNLLNSWRDLAEAYLHAGKIKDGLGIFTRLITRFPSDIWNFNILGMTLPHIGLNGLAVDILERGLALTAINDPENLHDQFRKFQQETQANLANGQDRTGEIEPETLQALRAALELPGTQNPDEDDLLPHIAPIDRLIALDHPDDRSLDAEILNQGQTLIPELLHMGMDSDLVEQSMGPWHAARLLNELRSDAAPELKILANWLDRTSAEDWQPWIGAKMFGKIGGYTFEELEAFARDPRHGNAIREAAIHELVERANLQPILRSNLMILIRDLLNRHDADQASEERFTANLIANAVDLNAQELLPDIQRAYAEDRVDQQIIDEAYTYKKLGLAVAPKSPRRTDGLYLRLECTNCGRVREHFTRFVLWDQTPPDQTNRPQRSPYILDHEVICPKCGAVEQYRMMPFEIVKLMQMDPLQLASILFNKEPNKPPKLNPHVYIVQGEAFGRPMHPLDTVDEYRRRIALDPKNGELFMRLGNTLRFIGRYEPTLEAYRKAVELAPDDPEILFPAATAEHDFGDPETARQLYERCLAQGNVLSIGHQGGLDENVVTAMKGLRELNKGEMSPWEYQLMNSKGQRLMPPKRQPFAKPVKKDKRAKRHKKKK